MKQSISTTVDSIHNGTWQRLECVGCKRRLHGPAGQDIPLVEVDKFVRLHALCGGAFREEKTPVS